MVKPGVCACRLAIAIVALLATRAGSAETLRLFGSAGAEAQLTPPNTASPLNPHNIARIPYQTNVGDVTTFAEAGPESRAWKLRLKLRGEASDRASDRGTVGEALVQFNVRKWLDITAGRVIEKWGTAYAWNPTSFVGPLKNPADPNDRRSSYRGLDMIRVDLFAKETNVSLYALERRSLAARAYRMIGGTDVSLHLRRDRNAMREGVSLSRVFGDALEMHAEIARTRREGAARIIRAVAGGQYTFPANVNLVLELYRGSDGLSRHQWDEFRAAVDGPSLRQANLAFSPLRMARNYAFIRLDWPASKLETELITIMNLRDDSALVRATLTYRIRANLSAYVIETEFFGNRDSEMAYIPIMRQTTIGARVYL